MMLQLNPPILLQTPKGKASAHMLIDYGPHWDLQWVTFVQETGECWTFLNPEVRQMENITHQYPAPSPIRPRDTPQRSVAQWMNEGMEEKEKASVAETPREPRKPGPKGPALRARNGAPAKDAAY